MLDFVSSYYPMTDILGTVTNPLCIALQGQPGDLIEYEYVIHIEYIGRSVGSKTDTHADSATYGPALQTVKKISAIQPVAPSLFGKIVKQFVAAVADNAPTIAGVATEVSHSLYSDVSGSGSRSVSSRVSVPSDMSYSPISRPNRFNRPRRRSA
jgi:hypothetical protein